MVPCPGEERRRYRRPAPATSVLNEAGADRTDATEGHLDGIGPLRRLNRDIPVAGDVGLRKRRHSDEEREEKYDESCAGHELSSSENEQMDGKRDLSV